MSQTFYEQLDVPSTASQSMIRDEYLTHLRKVRPDVEVNPDHHRVRDMYIAFNVLSDAAHREKYDLALAGAELCPWCGKPLAAYGLEHHVGEHVVSRAEDGCAVCGRLPTQRFDFRANTGRVVWHKIHRFEGNLCKTCATGVYRAMQTRNLAWGPWSIVSLFTTPYYLVRNSVADRRASSLAGPRPHDPEYDRGTGLGRPSLRSPAVWASLIAAAVLVVGVLAVLLSDGPAAVVPDAEVSQTTSTTTAPNDGWVVGGCAGFDMAGRVFPMECGDHFATVVALVATASECPESSDFSVPLTEGVACFEET